MDVLAASHPAQTSTMGVLLSTPPVATFGAMPYRGRPSVHAVNKNTGGYPGYLVPLFGDSIIGDALCVCLFFFGVFFVFFSRSI